MKGEKRVEGQMTIFDWQAIKEDIRKKLQETAENFVYIGYRLRQIEETESYKNDGVSSIYEFARKEYGLERTVTQRFMAINAKFSVDGNSAELLPQYREFGSSKLQEMLNLPEEDCQLLTAKATVKEIRELKAFNRQQDNAGQNMETETGEVSYTGLQKCIIDYFNSREKRKILNAVMEMALENGETEETIRQQAELINPSGYTNHQKGLVYLFLYEYDRGVAYKTIINNTITKLSWVEFVAEVVQIYGTSYGPDTWCNFYGPVEDAAEAQKEKETIGKPEKTESGSCATSHKNSAQNTEKSKPKQQELHDINSDIPVSSPIPEAEIEEEEDIVDQQGEEQLPGQTNIAEDFLEYMPRHIHHDLKCLPEYFEPIEKKLKGFELRKNDRDFRPGDTVTFREYKEGVYTGRESRTVTISYVLQNVPQYGLADGYCIFGWND